MTNTRGSCGGLSSSADGFAHVLSGDAGDGRIKIFQPRMQVTRMMLNVLLLWVGRYLGT